MTNRGDLTSTAQSDAAILRFPTESKFARRVQLKKQVALKGSLFFDPTAPGKTTGGNADKQQSVEAPESPLTRWLGGLGFSPSQVNVVDARVGMIASGTRHGTTREKALSALARDVLGLARAATY